jgi:hypothetical protein
MGMESIQVVVIDDKSDSYVMIARLLERSG